MKKLLSLALSCMLLAALMSLSACSKQKEMECEVTVGISKTESLENAEGARVTIDTDYYLILNLKVLNPAQDARKVSVKMVFENTNMLSINGFKGDSKPNITPEKDASGSQSITIDNMEFNIKGDNRETEKQNIFYFRASQPIANGSIDIYVTEGDTEIEKKYINYEFYKPVPTQKLNMPLLRVENGRLRWNAVDGATKYILSRNEQIKDLPTSVLSYDAEIFSYTTGPISIFACGDGVTYSDSETCIMKSEDVKFQNIVKDLELSNEGVLRWNSEGNDIYLNVDGTIMELASDVTEYSVTDDKLGSLKFQITVKGNNELLSSQEVVLEATRLAPPTSLKREMAKIVWSPVDGATGYEVFVDQVSVGIVPGAMWKCISGSHSVSVRAITTTKNYVNSVMSATTIYNLG